MKRLAATLSLFCLASMIGVSIHAQAQAAPRYALVIGNGTYAQGLPPLKNPVNDAADLAIALRRLGFQVTTLSNASRKQIDRALGVYREALASDKRSEGFFYYAGHGVQANGANYLIPVGAEINSDADLDDEAVRLDHILDKVGAAQNRVNIVVLDACRNNPLPSQARGVEQGLAGVSAAPPESIVLFSTAVNRTALDGKGRNSPFARALLDHLADAGDITETIKAVTAEVKQETAGAQTPFQYSNLDFWYPLSGQAEAQRTLGPSMSVSTAAGKIEVTSAASGTLVLDGAAMGNVPTGAGVRLDSVGVGERLLELRYADGQVERQTVTVAADTTTTVVFTHRIAPPKAAVGELMRPGEALGPGQSVVSVDGRFRFIYQDDGNLVLYGNGRALWASGTNGRGTGECIMQTDGNLVIYSPPGQAIWASNTAGSPGNHLVVQNDGNAVVYRGDHRPAWATNTVQSEIAPGESSRGDQLQPNQQLTPGQFLTSSNGAYQFVYQEDGNLVLYRAGAVLWASGTNGWGLGKLLMLSDGNVAVVDAAGTTPLWASNSGGAPGSHLIVQNDGNVVVYRPDGKPTWATNTMQ